MEHIVHQSITVIGGFSATLGSMSLDPAPPYPYSTGLRIGYEPDPAELTVRPPPK